MKNNRVGRKCWFMVFLFLCLFGGVAAIKASDQECCLTLPAYDGNEADSLVRSTYGASPFTGGIAPLHGRFTVDILPAGGDLNSPEPPISAGAYAAWCFDPVTSIDTGAFTGGNSAGVKYGGFLFSSCYPAPDAPGGLNDYLPNHPNVKQSAAIWKQVNYLINHRFENCGSRAPTMWEFQIAIYKLFGNVPPPQPNLPYQSSMVDCLLAKASANAPGWTPKNGDKVAVVYIIDLAFSDEVWVNPVQLIFLEVPCEIPPPAPPVCEVTGSARICSGESQNMSVSVYDGTAPYSYAWSGPNGFTSTNASITVTDAGVYTVTVTDSTPINPQTTTCSAVLEVTDGAPIFDNCPSDLDLGCNPDPSTIPTCNEPTTVTASDNHGSVTVSCSSIDTFNGCLRIRTITYSARNECGITECVQKITWKVDTTEPVIQCPPDITITNNVPNKCSDKWCDHRDCKDKCDEKWCDHRNCKDKCDNKWCDHKNCKDKCDNKWCDHRDCRNDWDKWGLLGALLNYHFKTDSQNHVTSGSSSGDPDTSPSATGFATATDDCDQPVITYSDETVPGDCDEAYKIVRTWVATDACGNTSSCTQNIFVGDCKEKCSGKGCDHRECKDKCSGHGCDHRDCKNKCKNKGCNYKSCKDKCSGHGCDHKDCKNKCNSKGCNYKDCKDKCSGHGCDHRDCKNKCKSKGCNYKDCKDKCSGHGCDHKDCKNKCNSKSCNYKDCKDKCSGHGCDHKDCKNKCNYKGCNYKDCKDKCSGHGCDHKDCKSKCKSKGCSHKDCKEKCSGHGCDHKDCKHKCKNKYCSHNECKNKNRR